MTLVEASHGGNEGDGEGGGEGATVGAEGRGGREDGDGGVWEEEVRKGKIGERGDVCLVELM